MRDKSITAVLNCHREGEILRPSLRSMVDSLDALDPTGQSWEILCIADKSDERTRDILRHELDALQRQSRDARIVYADLGDLGLSRNLAAENARGEFIGFVDGDDLVSRNWFSVAFDESRNHHRAILHPELNLYFGALRAFMLHRDQGHYDLWALFFHNLWTALSFGPASVYRQLPYVRNDLERGFGYEDWHWNCETIAAGLRHRVAPATCHFIRLKPGSLSRQSVERQCLIAPTRLWKYLVNSRPDETNSKGPTLGSWITRLLQNPKRRPRVTRPAASEETASATIAPKLFLDPSDINSRELPQWAQDSLSAAYALDPSVDVKGVIFNFSPVVPNPFLPYFPDELRKTVAQGVDTMHFALSALDVPALTPSDVLFAQSGGSLEPPRLSLNRFKTGLAAKYDLFLATLAVQSGCRRIRLHRDVERPDFLNKYRSTLENSVAELPRAQVADRP